MASCSCSGGEQTLDFHLYTTIDVGSDTAFGWNMRWTAPVLRAKRVPSLATISLQ